MISTGTGVDSHGRVGAAAAGVIVIAGRGLGMSSVGGGVAPQ